MGFDNPIVGGTALRIPAIQSPDYVTGVSGWIIRNDGSAEFNNVVIRGSTVSGGDILMYQGTPALGTLFLAISDAGGSDTFGNTYDAGITLIDSAGTDDPVARITAEFSTYGGGFWARGFQAPVNVFAQLQGGLLRFNAVDAIDQANADGNIFWVQDDGTAGYTEMVLSSGNYNAGEDPAWIELHPESSLRAEPEVKVKDNGGGVCNLTVSGQITEYNSSAGPFTTYTPTVSGGGTATFTTRTGWWTRIGKMIFFNAYVVINAAGSGGATVTITAPTNIDRTTRQNVPLHSTGIFAAGIGNGSAVALTTGATNVFDGMRTSNNGANNLDGTIGGANLLAGGTISITGWYREA